MMTPSEKGGRVYIDWAPIFYESLDDLVLPFNPQKTTMWLGREGHWHQRLLNFTSVKAEPEFKFLIGLTQRLFK